MKQKTFISFGLIFCLLISGCYYRKVVDKYQTGNVNRVHFYSVDGKIKKEIVYHTDGKTKKEEWFFDNEGKHKKGVKYQG